MLRALQGEEALLGGCLRSESGAWDEFVRRYSRLVYWSIGQTIGESRFGGRQDLIGDIFQDVFQKIFERQTLSRLDDAKNIKKFLVILSANLTLDRIKSISRAEDKSVFVDAEEAVGREGEELSGTVETPLHWRPDEIAIHHEKQRIIFEVLEDLGARERACLEMDVFDGKTHREIALIFGLPQDTVSSIIRRAKEKVKKKFSEKGI